MSKDKVKIVDTWSNYINGTFHMEVEVIDSELKKSNEPTQYHIWIELDKILMNSQAQVLFDNIIKNFPNVGSDFHVEPIM